MASVWQTNTCKSRWFCKSIERMLPNSVSLGLLVLRLSFGFLMILGHGWGKLANFTGLAEKFPDPLGIGTQLSLVAAIGAEVGCSILLIIGLCTRFATIPLAFTMCIALFVIHGADPWKKQELAAVFLAAYVTLLCTGAGRYSVDSWLAERKKSA